MDDPSFTQPTMYKKIQEFYQQAQEIDRELDVKIQSFRNQLEEQFALAEKYQPKVNKELENSDQL